MKKIHMILLVAALVMCFSSAYSLAAINQVYKINFEWFSQYNQSYSGEKRDISRDKWSLEGFPEEMKISIAGSRAEYDKIIETQEIENAEAANVNFSKYILVSCTFGDVYTPEYRIKVEDIAQRGNNVEVKISINSPSKLKLNTSDSGNYRPTDIIRIDRDAFPIKGNLWFIFKSQDGIELYQQYYKIE